MYGVIPILHTTRSSSHAYIICVYLIIDTHVVYVYMADSIWHLVGHVTGEYYPDLRQGREEMGNQSESSKINEFRPHRLLRVT